jgi:hypothetical protein
MTAHIEAARSASQGARETSQVAELPSGLFIYSHYVTK